MSPAVGGATLSVLDIAPVRADATPASALATTLALAGRAEELGFARFWVAEHHGMPNIASSSPAVLLAAIAAATTRIRVGSGGVMLPNHPPLVVAEAFATLVALFGDRVDLGIGRAPGTGPAAVRALRRSPNERFDEDLADLRRFVHGGFPPGHPFHGLTAMPATDAKAVLWLLGASVGSAAKAGALGLPYVFGHNFFGGGGTAAAVAAYRAAFRPSPLLAEPRVMIAVHVVCGKDDAHARWLAMPAVVPVIGLGGATADRPLPSPEDAAAQPWTSEQRARADELLAPQAVGGPEKVRRDLERLVELTDADELMITNNVTDPEEKLQSLERVRELADPVSGD